MEGAILSPSAPMSLEIAHVDHVQAVFQVLVTPAVLTLMSALMQVSITATTTPSALTIPPAGTRVLVTEVMKATELNALSSTPPAYIALLPANKSTSISTLVVFLPSRRPLLARSVLSPRSAPPLMDRRTAKSSPSPDPMKVIFGSHPPVTSLRASSKILMDN